MRENWDLFLTFARISASCFGGGYAMLPFFQRELVSKKGWLTLSLIHISEPTRPY